MLDHQLTDEQKAKTEALRRRLLEDTYASAFSGLSPVILDEGVIRQADHETLVRIARERGL